ncbi:MAG: hypothetical protein R2911_34145 [Caldilineaceae bacterium]
MALFTALTLGGGALVAGAAARRKSSPSRLVDVLIGGQPKQAMLLAPKLRQALTRAQQVAQELLGDTRQQQQQELNTTYEATEEQATEAIRRQDLMVASGGLGLALLAPVAAPLLFLPSIACSLFAFRSIFQDAYRVYREERKLDYRAVWAITIPLALGSGYVTAASFGGVLALLNFYLVAKTESRSKRHIADLFGGQVSTVWLLVDGVEVETPFAQVRIGDTVVVHAGQMIPVDGTIVEGMATIDQHMLTGESKPVEKEIGEPVLASTVLLSGRIHIRVDKAGDATVAAQIADMLSQTTDFKRTLESRTDRFMNQLTLPILGLKRWRCHSPAWEAVAVLWYYPGSRMLFFGPMSMLSYLQVAAQRGILIKDGRALEKLSAD